MTWLTISVILVVVDFAAGDLGLLSLLLRYEVVSLDIVVVELPEYDRLEYDDLLGLYILLDHLHFCMLRPRPAVSSLNYYRTIES